MRLIVMRHGQSPFSGGAATDRDRILSASGRHAAARVGQRLAELGWLPRWVLSSDAARTRETLECMRTALDPAPQQIEFRGDFYLAEVPTALAALAQLPTEADTVLAIGHNPGWENLVEELSGHSCSMAPASAVLLITEGTARWEVALSQRWRVADTVHSDDLE